MHRLHGGFTVAATIKPGCATPLGDTLKRLNRTQGAGPADFGKAETVLFVSGVILPEDHYQGETLPETFVFATTYCGPLSVHLDDLVQTNAACLVAMFRHCECFPPGDSPDAKVIKDYLQSHSYPCTFSSRYQCMTKAEISREKRLREEIQKYLFQAQELNAFDSLTALQVKTLIGRHIRIREDEFGWAFRPAKDMRFSEWLRFHRVAIITVLFIFLLDFLFIKHESFIPVFLGKSLLWDAGSIAALAIVVLAIMWVISWSRNPTATRPADEAIRKIAASQLHPVLNEMTAAAPLKSGNLRRWYYSSAHWVLRHFVKSIEVPTVSSIRWLVVNKRRRLLFLSNFSNMTDFYVRDFLNGFWTPVGINFMFTNGRGFPDAALLFLNGIIGDPEGYMNAVHAGQHVTDFWYAHEPLLTQDIIHKFRNIRNGLFREMNEAEAGEWLKLL
ncbi:MAG TPA: hypothetical protein VKQ52_09350 [Puia sp.]|nr:hypothetical protein [Puia sp.]